MNNIIGIIIPWLLFSVTTYYLKLSIEEKIRVLNPY